MKNAAEEKSPGTSSEQACSCDGGVSCHFAVRRIDLTAEAQQHALGVIARDRRFDDRGRAFRIQTREQHGGFHLRARHRQLVANARQRRRRL